MRNESKLEDIERSNVVRTNYYAEKESSEIVNCAKLTARANRSDNHFGFVRSTAGTPRGDANA